VVYFVSAGASITLPAATTAGQALLLIQVSQVFSNAITINRAGSDLIFDHNASDSGQTSIQYASVLLISDGNHHWYLGN